jgi:hypothetical protein
MGDVMKERGESLRIYRRGGVMNELGRWGDLLPIVLKCLLLGTRGERKGGKQR